MPHWNSRFFNPLMLWLDVALTTQEMFVSSGTVIQARTQRMAQAGLSPTPEDIAEFQLMGHEKLDAVTEAGAAIANQLHSTHFGLMNRAALDWVAGAEAMLGLGTSASPDQFATHADALAQASTRGAATLSQLASAGARIAKQGLKPLHAKARSNAQRLAALPPAPR